MTFARTALHAALHAAMLPALLGATAAGAASPSFSCARPAGAVEETICQDDTLAALDRENARLFALARATPESSAQARKELVAMQRGWIKGRNDCWKTEDAKACIRDAYVIRISELRAGYAAARAKGGVSIGPVAVQCPGMPAMAVTFVNVDPSLAYLGGGEQSLVMTISPSGSGARYGAQTPAGEASFWQKGPEAMVQLPGGKEQRCHIGQ